MSKFITLHSGAYPVYLNVNHIIAVCEEDDNVLVVVTPHPNFTKVIVLKESYDEVIRLINS